MHICSYNCICGTSCLRHYNGSAALLFHTAHKTKIGFHFTCIGVLLTLTHIYMYMHTLMSACASVPLLCLGISYSSLYTSTLVDALLSHINCVHFPISFVSAPSGMLPWQLIWFSHANNSHIHLHTIEISTHKHSHAPICMLISFIGV